MAETKKTNNLRIWERVCETDPKKTKGFKGKGGFQGTAICAQSQRQMATELFGPYGIGWRVEDEVYEVLYLDPADPHTARLVYKAQLVFNFEGEAGNFPICSEIEMFMFNRTYKAWVETTDLHKKVRTDAVTKGLSELGFNSDIFEGKFDDNKYLDEMKTKFGEGEKNELPKATEPKEAVSVPKKPKEKDLPAENSGAKGTPEPTSPTGNAGKGEVDNPFKEIVDIANNAGKHNIEMMTVPKIMGVAVKSKGDNAALNEILSALKKYIEGEPAELKALMGE